MTAHQHLRQLHELAEPNWTLERWRNPDSTAIRLNGKGAVDFRSHSGSADLAATLRNALPQLANLAEAAARIASEPDQRSIADGWDSIARAYQRDAARALAALEQALNPTRNTQ